MNDPFSKLKTAVWVYDIDNFCISWANEKALDLWEADSPEELRTRDFKVGSSDAVRSSLLDYQQAFRRGRNSSANFGLSLLRILSKKPC